MPMSLVAEVMPLLVPPVPWSTCDDGSSRQFAFETFRALCTCSGHQLQQQRLALRERPR